MRDSGLISQSLAKRTIAAALMDRQRARGWSNTDAGDILGVGEGTIRNRLDTDDVGKQMTVFELARSIRHDSPEMANQILSQLTGFHLVPDQLASAAEALDMATDGMQQSAALLALDPDVGATDRRALLAKVINLKITLNGVEALLRGEGQGLD